MVAFLVLMDGGTWCFLACRFYDALSDMLLRQAPSDAMYNLRSRSAGFVQTCSARPHAVFVKDPPSLSLL